MNTLIPLFLFLGFVIIIGAMHFFDGKWSALAEDSSYPESPIESTGWVSVWMNGLLLKHSVKISFFSDRLCLKHLLPYKRVLVIHYSELKNFKNVPSYKNDFTIFRNGSTHTISLRKTEAQLLARLIRIAETNTR